MGKTANTSLDGAIKSFERTISSYVSEWRHNIIHVMYALLPLLERESDGEVISQEYIELVAINELKKIYTDDIIVENYLYSIREAVIELRNHVPQIQKRILFAAHSQVSPVIETRAELMGQFEQFKEILSGMDCRWKMIFIAIWELMGLDDGAELHCYEKEIQKKIWKESDNILRDTRKKLSMEPDKNLEFLCDLYEKAQTLER